MGLAEGEREDVAEGFGVMEAGTGDAKERDPLGGEKPVDEGIPAGAAAEHDTAEDAAGSVTGEQEVDVPVGDPVEGGLAAAFGADLEEIGEADLDRDAAEGADQRFEDGEEVPLGRCHEMLLPTDPVELPDAAAVVAERQMEREGEQCRADEETGHQIGAEGEVRSGFGRRDRCGRRSGGGVIGLPFRPAGKGGTDEQREDREPEEEALHGSGYSPEMKHRGRYVIVRGHDPGRTGMCDDD